METDVAVRRVTDGIQLTLHRLSTLASGIALLAAAAGAATFATGWWVFDHSTAWIVIGGALCIVPVAASLVAWLLLRLTAKHTAQLVDNVRTFLGTPSPAATALIDYDTGQTVVASSKSFSSVRGDLRTRAKELPALYAGVRAIASVPGLVAVAVLGIVGVGLLGTILLIGGIID